MIIVSVMWHFTVVLIYISLIIRNVENLFIGFLAIHIPFLEKYLFISFAHFLFGLLEFLLLSFRSSLYIFNINSLLDKWFILFLFWEQ